MIQLYIHCIMMSLSSNFFKMKSLQHLQNVSYLSLQLAGLLYSHYA